MSQYFTELNRTTAAPSSQADQQILAGHAFSLEPILPRDTILVWDQMNHNVRPALEGGSMIQLEAKVITVSELAVYLHVHRSTLYRLLKKGQLPAFKIGSDWRFNVEAIDQWRMQQGTALSEISRNEVQSVH